MQNITLRTTAEVDVLADTLSVGIIRAELDDDGIVDEKFFNKDELIANLTAKVVSVQKTHPYNIKLDYLFFDKDGEITNNDREIKSVQFRVQYVDKKGKVRGTAERRLAIDQLVN